MTHLLTHEICEMKTSEYDFHIKICEKICLSKTTYSDMQGVEVAFLFIDLNVYTHCQSTKRGIEVSSKQTSNTLRTIGHEIKIIRFHIEPRIFS